MGSKVLLLIWMFMFGQKGQLLGDTLAPPELQHPPLDTCSSSQLECVGQCVANKRDRVGRERAEPWVEMYIWRNRKAPPNEVGVMDEPLHVSKTGSGKLIGQERVRHLGGTGAGE